MMATHQTSSPVIVVPGAVSARHPTPFIAGTFPGLDVAIAARRVVGLAAESPHEDCRKPSGLDARTGFQSAAGMECPEPSAQPQTLYEAAFAVDGMTTAAPTTAASSVARVNCR
jgi:hypothetical protein